MAKVGVVVFPFALFLGAWGLLSGVLGEELGLLVWWPAVITFWSVVREVLMDCRSFRIVRWVTRAGSWGVGLPRAFMMIR